MFTWRNYGFTIFIGACSLFIGFLIGCNSHDNTVNTAIVVTPTPIPFQDKRYVNLRYDTREINSYYFSGDLDYMQTWENRFFKDQKLYEQKYGVLAPSYCTFVNALQLQSGAC